MDEQEPWRFMVLNEFCKVAGHGANVSRGQDAPSLGGDPKNFRISSTIWDNASSRTKVDGWLTTA